MPPTFLKASGKDFDDVTKDVTWVTLGMTARYRGKRASEQGREEPWDTAQERFEQQVLTHRSSLL